MNLLFGCDPEMFLLDGFNPVSAWGKFPGTKEAPHRLSRGAVQVDGNALEFNIDPAESEDEFVDFILRTQAEIEEMVAKQNLMTYYVPIIEFDKEQWDALPPEAKILGCSPDYNSSGVANCGPEIPDGIRTAAGHIHVGWDDYLDPNSEDHIMLCAALSAHVEREWYKVFPMDDDDVERLKYYGANASFRPKQYGIEFRFPTNKWLTSIQTMRLAYQTVDVAVREFFGE